MLLRSSKFGFGVRQHFFSTTALRVAGVVNLVFGLKSSIHLDAGAANRS